MAHNQTRTTIFIDDKVPAAVPPKIEQQEQEANA